MEGKAALERVQTVAAEKRRTDEEFKAAIIAAYEEAFTLRQIAEYAGISREGVRTIVNKRWI